MIFFSTLIFSGWNWVGLVAGAFGLVLLLVWWSYGGAPHGFTRWVCAGLKLLGVAGLAFALLEPLWSGQRARPGANLFAIVADNSQRLRIKDRGKDQTRGETLRAMLDPQRRQWQETIEEHFEVRRYFFDSRVQTTKDFSELAFDGRASALGSTLRTLADRYRGRPLAGVLLLTDGNATDLHSAPDLDGLPPVYPVVIGSQEPIKDIALRQVRATQTDFEDAPVTIQADVAAAGYSGDSIVAKLVDAAGRQVAEQTLEVGKDENVLAFRFQFRPEKPGLSFYRVRVRAKGESDDSQRTEEATLANNSAVVTVERGRGEHRILYVAGRPNWEFKFLNRALQEDEQLQLVALFRVAKREAKFNFLGRAGENSNPLFRGFEKQSPEDVERYDQPVLHRQNTRDELELAGGFPKKPEELYAYDAVIVGDLEAAFFTPDQALLAQKFVSERGGGFLMLGGMESFQEGKYQRTPIGDMLPVYLERADELKAPGSWRFNLTAEGFLQSWARLRDNEADEKTRLQGMTPFQVLNRVKAVKPGASVIATVTEEGGKTYPALVVQRFGRGRTAALTLGDFWRWGFHDADAHKDLDKAWRQLARWLVTDVPKTVELTVEPKADDANGAVMLQIRARAPDFQPLDNASVSLEVEPELSEPGGTATNTIRLTAEASGAEPGLYEAMYVPRLNGGFKASASVTNSAGLAVGRAAAGWSADLTAEEFRSLTPNIGLLESIARKTGGEVIRAEALEDFARGLPNRHAPVMENWTKPFWHTPAMFAFALACFASEWGLRRWKGMP